MIKKLLILIVLLILQTFCAYNPRLAKDLALASAIALSNQADINAWNCTLCSSFPLKSVINSIIVE